MPSSLVPKDETELYGNDEMYFEEYAFRCACTNGHWEKARELYHQHPTLNIHSYEDEAFRYACGNGHRGIACWLISLDRGELVNVCIKEDDNKMKESAIYLACRRRQVRTVQWLLSLGAGQVLIETPYIRHFLRMVITTGNVSIAKMIYSKFEHHVLDYVDMNLVLFRDVCFYGHLDMAKWLHSLQPCGRLLKSYFTLAGLCTGNVRRWLISLEEF